VSNVVVSTGEDVATVGLLGLAIANPVVAALIALILVIVSLWLVFAARRALKRFLEPKRRETG
jgi:Flp pilus assembly protein TadB